jgi:hypothetical protein
MIVLSYQNIEKHLTGFPVGCFLRLKGVLQDGKKAD